MGFPLINREITTGSPAPTEIGDWRLEIGDWRCPTYATHYYSHPLVLQTLFTSSPWPVNQFSGKTLGMRKSVKLPYPLWIIKALILYKVLTRIPTAFLVQSKILSDMRIQKFPHTMRVEDDSDTIRAFKTVLSSLCILALVCILWFCSSPATYMQYSPESSTRSQ